VNTFSGSKITKKIHFFALEVEKTTFSAPSRMNVGSADMRQVQLSPRRRKKEFSDPIPQTT
jgi:hypothetical protein